MLQPLSLIAAALVASLLAAPAVADCGALLDALQKANAQSRVAQYEVERADDPLPASPTLVRIGQVEYIAMSIGGRVSHYEAHDAPAGGNPMIATLRSAMKDGKASCDNAGSGSVRGNAADKIRLDGKTLPQMTLWIDRRSGLPLYHQVPSLGVAYAWAFGDAVKQPKTGR